MEGNSPHVTIGEIPGALWISPDAGYNTGAGLLYSEPTSARGSFRAEEIEESALCCSLSVSEDGLSEYSENQSHYGSESGSKKSGRGSAGASPLTSGSERSSPYPGNRSLPSPAYLSSGVASSVVASGSTPSVSGSESSGVGGPPLAVEEALRSSPEEGGVSPKRRGQGKGGGRKAHGGAGGVLGSGAGRGETLRGGWLGRPAGHPPPRGQVMQSCFRPGLGSVRTIMEEDEEGLDEDSDFEVVALEKGSRTGSKRFSPGDAIPTVKTEEKAGEDQSDGQHAKGHFFIRSSSDQSKGAGDMGLRRKGNSERAAWPAGRPPVHEAPGCLCPVANTPDGSSVADSPPGSPQGDRLSMSVYFCGLPGTGYGRRKRSCGLCGRQVGRRAPQCSLCRLVVYCDRRCLDQHQADHYRSCPGASARRLREAASALRMAESGFVHDGVENEDSTPLKRPSQDSASKKGGVAEEALVPEQKLEVTADTAPFATVGGVDREGPSRRESSGKGSKARAPRSPIPVVHSSSSKNDDPAAATALTATA